MIFKNSIVRVKNITHSQPAMCESKTSLTRGPERPFRCLDSDIISMSFYQPNVSLSFQCHSINLMSFYHYDIIQSF